MNDADIVYDPARAAELLNVSASGLRRLAPIYESVFGELKRTGKGDEDKRSREWPNEAIERLRAARVVTGRGRPYRTIEAALEAIRDGVEVDTAEIDFGGRQTGADAAIGEALQVLLSEVRALRTEVQELKQGRELPPAHNPAPEIKNPGKVEGTAPPPVEAVNRQHSLLVRAALWLEQIFKG